MFCSGLCLALVGMLLMVMLDGSGITGQMINLNVNNPEIPLPLNGPIKFKTIVKNVGNAYSDGNKKIQFLILTKCSIFFYKFLTLVCCTHCSYPSASTN